MTDKGERIDDFYILDEIPITDENGNAIEFAITLRKENFEQCMYDLCWGRESEKGIAVTPNFRKKYPHFLDLFIHYSPLAANDITFIGKRSSYEKREAYFEVDSKCECIKRHYIVKFTLDEKGYLDDADVKCVGEYPYERKILQGGSTAILYQNSNWNNLKLTENFKKKYKPEEGIIPNVEEVYYGEGLNGTYVDYKTLDTFIYQFISKTNSKRWYGIKYIKDANDYIDDVEIYNIDYTGDNAEEAKGIYLNSIKQ